MNDYQARKEARRAAFKANQGKPQPRRVFRVYGNSSLNALPEGFENRPLGAFSSRAEAEAFAFGKNGSKYDIGSADDVPAFRAMVSMLPRDTVCYACYAQFRVVAEEV